MKVWLTGGGTGGHLTPALAIAEGLERARDDLQVLMIGAERGIEARLLPERGRPFVLLPAEPIYRKQWWRNLKWPWLAGRLIRQIDELLDVEHPALVVGTGGYVAAPVVWRAARRGIPTAIHESNAYPGFATRRLARHVRHLYLGFAAAESRLRPGAETAVFVTGTPIHPPSEVDPLDARRSLGLRDERTTVLVFGGSQGARVINRTVAKLVEGGWFDERALVWCTGHGQYEDFKRHARAGQIAVFPFLDPLDPAYAVADLAITRAGAMTCAELAAWGVPAVYVPLRIAAHNHQLHNAFAMMETMLGGWVIRESELSPASLARGLDWLLGSPERLPKMREELRERARPHAIDDVVSNLLTLLS